MPASSFWIIGINREFAPVGSVLPWDTFAQLGYRVRVAEACDAPANWNRILTEALDEKIEAVFWMDARLRFEPPALERLFNTGHDFISGVYPNEESSGFNCEIPLSAYPLQLGQGGGVIEARFAELGFTLMRRALLESLRDRQRLPRCSDLRGRAIIPFFAPLAIMENGIHRYLDEQRAFCERARLCGFPLRVDTSLRIWRMGFSSLSWEDVQSSRPRQSSAQFHLRPGTTSAKFHTVSSLADSKNSVTANSFDYEKVNESELDDPRFDQPALVEGKRRRKYFICSTPCSGSSILTRQLFNAGIGIPHLYFNPTHLNKLSEHWGLGKDDPARFIQDLLDRRTTSNGAWGARLYWAQVEIFREELETLFRDSLFLYFYREDINAQSLSYHLSRSSGIWSLDGSRTTRPDSEDRLADLQAVREAETLIRSENRCWEQFFRDLKIEPLKIRYEHYTTNQHTPVIKIAEKLGLTRNEFRIPPAEPFVAHLSSEMSEAKAQLREALKMPPEPVRRISPIPASRKFPRNSMRTVATKLAESFPRIKAYALTYPANIESLNLTLDDFRKSDWGEEPEVFVQPSDWPKGKDSASNNYKRALLKALEDDCDFALILEDDIRVTQALRHNLITNPLIHRDQCDYFSLFMPDLINSPWERSENHLGYRLAKPLYAGPNRMWEKHRIWGSQAYLLSRRFLKAAVDLWDQLTEGQDARVITVCSRFQLPLWYPSPCLIEHVPLTTAFGTPSAYAPDFDRDHRLEILSGFQPPEEVPGWLTYPEAKLLWELAAGKNVLELGTAGGKSTVCLGQQAKRVLTVDIEDQLEATEWVRRYGLTEKVEFRQGDAGKVCRELEEKFDLVFIDTEHDAASVSRDIESSLPLLKSNGIIAFHDYPDPGWPEVRKTVDHYARKNNWRRFAQAEYLGAFRLS